MSTTLYDATVARFLQTLRATENVLQKGADWCKETGCDPAELVGAQLRDDMFPLLFQIVSVRHHSLGAIQGVESGLFTPPPSHESDYSGLQDLVKQTVSELSVYDADAIGALADNDLTFKTQRFSVDFKGQDFLLSFSLPNFYFHATTAYDILRAKGVALGKLDFLGSLSTKG